jgi:hypothetical protein
MKKPERRYIFLCILCIFGLLLLVGCDRPVQDEPGDGDHTHLPWKLNAVLPGCTTTGLTEGSVCSICDEILVAQEEIPALGHDAVDDPIIELGCVVDGKSAGSHCSRCDKKFELQRITERSTGHRYENGICTVCGEAIEYSQGLKLLLRKDGTYAVSGIGTFEGAHLVIPETAPDGTPITRILKNAFREYKTLRSVHIPDSIVEIEEWAFAFSEIAYVRLPDTLTSIEPFVFYSCMRLKSIHIPSGVQSIGNGSFCLCTALTSLDIPASVQSIGESSFSHCFSLTSIVIPSTVKSLDDNAFSYCDSLQEIIICEGITSFSTTAFSGNSSLQRVSYPCSMSEFYGFINCPQLTQIDIPEDHPSLYVKDGCVLGKTAKVLYYLPKGASIPDDGSVNRLYAGSMASDHITEVVLPSSIIAIDTAFAGNQSLTRVVLPEGLNSVPSDAFSGCISLREVVLPSTLSSIGSNAFWACRSLQNITLPSKLVTIGQQAFRYCTSLTEITIPGVVKKLGWMSFAECTALERVVIEEGVGEIGADAFYGCSALKELTLPQSLTKIDGYAFSNCSSLQAVTLPQKLTYLGECAFSGCSSLTEIDVPFLDTYAKSAFSGCKSLERATVGEGVTQIASYLFSGCESLRYVYIPSTAKWLGHGVFMNADALETLEYGGTAEQWEKVRVDAGNTAIHQAERICRQ